MCSLGIDIGYASVKMALIDQDLSVRQARYQLHRGDGRGVVRRFVEDLGCPWSEIKCGAVTGSGAKILDGTSSIGRVNEVAALVEGAGAAGPAARSIIEIGGQSAKYVTGLGFPGKSHIKIAMNSSCSAGTGSFLEEQVSRLDLRLEDYSSHAAQARTIPRIAGRCSVFAKTDITHHQQEGVPVADILLGLAYAVVRNYRVSVMKKLPRQTPILLAGGVAHNQGVLIALKDLLELGDDELIIPDNMDTLVALGAALIAAKERLSVDPGRLLDLDRPDLGPREYEKPLPALAAFGRDDHSAKHEVINVKDEDLDCYLGVDVGSTSVNLVLIDRRDRIVGYRYLRTLGRPLDAVKSGLASLDQEFDGRLNVLGACTTGSGRYMTGRLIGADQVKDEITAQAKAAVTIDPEVDTVFEIGGQDSKYISLDGGVVIDFQMNKICAAGTGSFIEEQAKKFDIPISRIGDMALAAESPINLGERCTVFMETSIAAHLGQGAPMTDLTAGLCYSIVKNYLNRVVGQKKVGRKVFFQGGVAHNQGVINAFRSLTGRDVIVPPFFSVTGALGAALLAREAMAGRQTSFKGFYPSQDFLRDEQKLKSGRTKDSAFNRSVEELIFEGYTGDLDPDKKTVGIPRALFTFGMFSMFNRIFTELGFNVLLSDPTSEKTIALGQEYSLDETCYPVKLINGHVAELVAKGVDFIFFPDLYSVDHPGSPSRKNYGCAYMQLAFKVVNRAMDLDSKGIGLLAPTIAFSLGREFMMKSFAGMGRQLGKSPEETGRALQKGMQAFLDLEARMERAGQAALDGLDPERKTFVLISKIYGVADPVLNLGIADKLMDMGYQVLPFYCLPEGDLSHEHPNMYWPFAQHILEPAQLIREHPNLYAVLLTHHGCGPDSVVAHFFREQMQGKPFLHVEVDEHSSGVGVITRVEAFVNSLGNRPAQAAEAMDSYQAKVTHTDENITTDVNDLAQGTTLYLPPLYPYAEICSEILVARGVAAQVLPPTDAEAVDLGRTFTMAEEYFSLTALMGDVLKKCRSRQNGDRPAFLLPRTEGAEVDGQYGRMVRLKLDEEGRGDVAVVSPFLEDLLDGEESDLRSLFLGLLAGDLVRAAPSAVRSERLGQIARLVRDGRLTVETLRDLAMDVGRELRDRSWLRRILVVGEPMILYNDYLNDFLFRRIEDRGHRVFYAPFSEAMWLLWRDYADQNAGSAGRQRLLDQMADDARVVSECLGPEGPFERDVASLAGVADKVVGYYAGAFGRFRAAKVFSDHPHMDGIITAASTYENTGISLNILHKALAEGNSRPILNLTFDGNRSENDVTKCDSFLYYL
jgi:predicted CoA-substrate-specific enzyme activase